MGAGSYQMLSLSLKACQGQWSSSCNASGRQHPQPPLYMGSNHLNCRQQQVLPHRGVDSFLELLLRVGAACECTCAKYVHVAQADHHMHAHLGHLALSVLSSFFGTL